MTLRFFDGTLQQRWTRKVAEYRNYGGIQRRCEGYEFDWREVPQVWSQPPVPR